jgi:hypothetical protein
MWGQWHISWYQHKKWLIRECIIRYENIGALNVSGSVTTWTVGVNDKLEPTANPRDSNDCIEFSAAAPHQWCVPITAFGPTEKYVIALPEKTTRTGEVDGPVVCLLVQSLEAGVKPGIMSGKISIRLIVKLIEPVPRRLYTREQAQELFGTVISGVQSSDQVSQRVVAFNQVIERSELEVLYLKKKGRNIGFNYKTAIRRSIDYRGGTNMRLV